MEGGVDPLLEPGDVRQIDELAAGREAGEEFREIRAILDAGKPGAAAMI